MPRVCECMLCQLSRISQGSQMDSCEAPKEQSGTPVEIIEAANRVISVTVSPPVGSELQTADMKYMARRTCINAYKSFRAVVTVNGFRVRLDIEHQHKAITRSNPQAHAFIWNAPNGFSVLSSIHPQLANSSIYLKGASKVSPDHATRDFKSKADAQTYYANVVEALMWFIKEPAAKSILEFNAVYSATQDTCIGTLEEKPLKPLQVVSCPTIDEDGVWTFYARDVFKCTIKLQANTVIFEVFEQHEALSCLDGTQKTWLEVDGFCVITRSYVQLGKGAVSIRGINSEMPDRVVRIFKNDNQAAVYRHTLVRAIDRFMNIAKATVEAYNKDERIEREHEERERQREAERAPWVYGRQSLFLYNLVKTNRRLTFDILYQHPLLTNNGNDDDYYFYKAKNGIEIISQSRMDIQTNRLWLRGCVSDDRSGSMVFSDNAKRDKMYYAFQDAIDEWLHNKAIGAVRDGRHICDTK